MVEEWKLLSRLYEKGTRCEITKKGNIISPQCPREVPSMNIFAPNRKADVNEYLVLHYMKIG